MLGGVSWAVVVAASFTTVWYLAVDRHMPKMMPALLGFTLLSVANAVGLRLPYLLRTGVLLASLFTIGAYAVAIGGFAPNAVLTLSVVTVTTTLLLGRSAGLVATLLGAGALFGVALAHRSGAVTRAPEWAAYIDSRDLANTMRVTAIFALLSGTLVIAVSYLLTRSEQLAVEKARSLARLEQEQGEKERIARDLELRDAAFRKAQELELLGRLAGSMAHDFNNSLLVIWSALDELKYLGPLPTAIEPALAAVRAAAEQAAATTKQLRAFGPTALQKSADLALGPVIAKTKTMLARLLPQNLELVVDVDLPVTISADEGEVLRVITNLALNARDAMRDGGKLTLRLRRPATGSRSSRTPAPPTWCWT
jgi:signal transduction histidine kinase